MASPLALVTAPADLGVVHDNGRNGIGLYGQQRYANEDVYVGRCIAFGNSGIPGVEQNSGSGIILGSVNGGVIERSIAHSNGYLADAQEGPVGIWTYESNNIIIQHNTSYGNRTAATADGGGFDLDGGVTNSVLQYNLSFENDGAGYGLYQFPSASEWRNNVIRGNVSYNDGRKNDYGAITLWSGGSPLGAMEISDNHIVMSPAPSGKPSAITFYTTVEKAIFKSNTLIVSGDVDFVTHRKPTEPAVQGFPPAVGGPVFQDNVFLRVRGQSYFRGCASTEGHWQHCQ
jgi:hypothetical protein